MKTIRNVYERTYTTERVDGLETNDISGNDNAAENVVSMRLAARMGEWHWQFVENGFY